MDAFDLDFDDDEFIEETPAGQEKLDQQGIISEKTKSTTLNNTLPNSESLQQKEIDFTKNSQNDEKSDGAKPNKRSYRQFLEAENLSDGERSRSVSEEDGRKKRKGPQTPKSASELIVPQKLK